MLSWTAYFRIYPLVDRVLNEILQKEKSSYFDERNMKIWCEIFNYYDNFIL